MKSSVHVIISGRVQGVWFRASNKNKAEQLGITGWVRNTSEGDVEAVFVGDKDILDEMIKWCNQGPAHAKVNNVKVENIRSTNDFETFTIKY